MIIETVCVGAFQVNCYIISGEKGSEAILIDPGDESEKIKKALDKHKLKPVLIINTHGHIDHIGADEDFGVPIYVHAKDLVLLRDAKLNLSTFLVSPYSIKSEIKTLENGENIKSAGITFKVIHTPGHTPGGICLLMKEPKDKILFCGDTLFSGSIGRTDFAGADGELLIRSIKDKLLKLADDTVLYPGHGPTSTIGEERKNNPFLK